MCQGNGEVAAAHPFVLFSRKTDCTFSTNIEYKVSLPDKSEKYMKTIVAFSNTQDGKLIVGVDNKTVIVVSVEAGKNRPYYLKSKHMKCKEERKMPRACLKNYSCNLHAPLCGIFHPNSVVVARYDALIRAKSPTNCDAHLAENLFQTRSRKPSLDRLWSENQDATRAKRKAGILCRVALSDYE